MEKQIRVLVVVKGRAPVEKWIDSNLESLQDEVNGYIETVSPFSDNVSIICNEDGKLIGMPYNRALRDEEGHVYDVIAGTFLIVASSGDGFSSLSDEQLGYYKELFRVPEEFFTVNGKTIVTKMFPGRE